MKINLKSFLVFLILVTSMLSLVLFFIKTASKPETVADKLANFVSIRQQTESKAINEGKKLSHNKCEGEGPVTLTHSPMDPEDFSILIPYGLMIGEHVTPIDHQYFAPFDYNSPRDSFNVYAMADAKIVEIGARQKANPRNPNDKYEEYRIVFSHTCTFFTYYDLVTSLSPDLKTEYDKRKSSNGYAGNIDFEVKAGQLIGKIGGQTLDFAVWNTEKPLTGFVVPEHYRGEPWKIFIANPYDYVSADLKQLLTDRNPRTVEPIEGKIDYDIDEKLIGNWFIEGTGGYTGGSRANYWETHLSISPDHFDPTSYIISFGNFNGKAQQFTVVDKSFDPTQIGVTTGLVKYTLANFTYVDNSGNYWDRVSLVKSLKLIPSTDFITGCVLFEMIDTRKLKMESFPSIACREVTAFTDNVQIYER